MSILKAALNRENVDRDHKKAVTEDRGAERTAAVAAIQKVFLPEVSALETLYLRGDYNRPIAFTEAQTARVTPSSQSARLAKFGSTYCTAYGLEVHLGAKISRECLILTVADRTDLTPLQAIVRIERNHPYKSETVATFHGHADPTEMLEKFFETLAKYVVDVNAA